MPRLAQLPPPLAGYESHVLLAVLVTIAYAIYQNFFAIHYPKSILRIGEAPGKTSFSWRTYWRYYTDCPGLFRDAYENVCLPCTIHWRGRWAM
jgi:hypothetical protein